MRQVNGPNGVVNFPASMTDSQIESALQRLYPVRKTFAENVGQDFNKRSGNVQTSVNEYLAGNQSLPEASAQVLGNGLLGFANDVGGQAFSSIFNAAPDIITQPLKQGASSVLNYLADTPVGAAASSAAQAYSDFEQNNPRAARNLDAVANIGGALTAFGPAKSAATAAPAVITDAGRSVYNVGSAVGNTITDGASSAVSKIADSSLPALDNVVMPVLDLAKKHKMVVGLSDLSDNEAYKRVIAQGESLPFSRGSQNAANQQKSVNKAVSRTFTDEVENLTPEVMNNARKNLGANFQKFTDGKDFDLNPEYLTRLDEINNSTSRGVYGRDSQNLYDIYKGDVDKALGPSNTIKGEQLDRLRRQFSQISRETADEGTAKLASDFENAMVDLIKAGDPEIAKELSDLKYKYKNYKTVQGLTIKDQVSGNISPTQLMGRVVSSFGPDAVSTGQAGDLGEIARVAQTMRKLNDSGTAKNQVVQQILNGNLTSALPIGLLLNPLVGAAQAAGTGAAWAVNRGLQARDIDPSAIERALIKTQAPSITIRPSDRRK